MKTLCGHCPWHRYTLKKPDSILARLWRWHTSWCPGWKAYMAANNGVDGMAVEISKKDPSQGGQNPQ